jgi:adenylyltransferase/sulfurtransferase
MSQDFQITVHELKLKLDQSEPIVLIDVRENYEREISSLPQSIHLPLGVLISNIADLDIEQDRDVIVYCRSGMRSQTAATILRQHGVSRVYNLIGGITAWQAEIDPSMPVA